MSTIDIDTGFTGDSELEFERPLRSLEQQIEELEKQSKADDIDFSAEIRSLRENHTAMLKKIYSSLSPWHTVQVARSKYRPQTIDYIRGFVKDFCELHGDRHYGDDKAIITGFGRIGPHKCLVIGHHKGKDVRDKVAANFGCAHPEGYRKALSKMKLAAKYHLPVICLIDTPGAYPGVGAEERGQAQVIAENMYEMSRLGTPIVCVVIGEGGSGGALGIGVGDRVAMLQHAYYSVISPEGCAGILWKSGEYAEKAAEALRLTSRHLSELGVIDDVIQEPLGGAHRDHHQMASRLKMYLVKALQKLTKDPVDELLDGRYEKYRRLGVFTESAVP